MNGEEPLRDQAERLRKRVSKKIEREQTEESASSLPPRSEVHQQHQKKKLKWHLKYPLIRLLAIFFILLPIVIFSIYSVNQSKKVETTPTEVERGDYERVEFQQEYEDEGVKKEDKSGQ